MNNLLKRNKILVGGGLSLFLTALLVLFFTTSCNNLIQVQDQPQEGKASLVVTVPGHRAASDNIKSYTVDVNGASGNVATAKVKVGGTASFADMAPGEYTVVVQGYDSNGTVIFKGENKATVVAGESTSVVIELKGTSFKVTLYSNIDSADPVTQTINYGDKLPQDIFTKRDGYTLAGWTEKQDGSGTVYDANTPVIFTEDKTLYAQWAVSSFTTLQSEVAKGGTVSVSGNINVTTGLTVSNTVTLVATSGGATLTNETDTTTLSPLFTVNSGTLTLGDGINSLTLDGNAKTAYGVRVESGEVIMKDKVTIQKAANSGVYLSGGKSVCKFTMDGGLITGNTSVSGGGGVFVSTGTDTQFTMTGGEISGNIATSNYGSSGGGVSVSGTFNMEGGKITGNTATSSGNTARGSGGGVYVYGTFTMTGGEISGNTATSGKEVYYTAGATDTTFKMGGNATLKGGEVYLNNNTTTAPITLTSSLASGSATDPVATITPRSYGANTTVLTDDSSGSLVSSEASKFAVTPDGGTQYTINDSGVLQQVTQ